jgi:hypothetical protein
MAKYKVLAKEGLELEDFKKRLWKWDKDSIITELQVNDKKAQELVEEELLEVIEE